MSSCVVEHGKSQHLFTCMRETFHIFYLKKGYLAKLLTVYWNLRHYKITYELVYLNTTYVTVSAASLGGRVLEDGASSILCLEGKTSLCIVTHSINTCSAPHSLFPKQPSNMPGSLVELQEGQAVADLLLCPSSVPFWLCRSVGFALPVGHWGKVGALAYLSRMTGLARKQTLLPSQQGACKRLVSVFSISKAVCNQALESESNYSCPGPRGWSRTVGRNAASCLLSFGWCVLWWEHPPVRKNTCEPRERKSYCFRQGFIFC